MAALAAACSGDDSPVVEPGAPVATATTTAAGGPSVDPAGSVPPVATDPGSGQVVDGEAPAGGDAPAGTAPPASPPTFPALDAGGPPGSFAPAVLRPQASARVVLELHSAPGVEPSAPTVEHLRATLAATIGKPIEVTTGAAASGATTWSDRSIREAADTGAATAQGDGTAVLRLLFLHGTFEGDGGILGVAVRGDVAAVMVDRASSAAGLLGDPQSIVTSVATHEVGHLLGLVDLVLSTGRADPDHPGHSANPASVMYWAVESDLISSVLGARPPRDFDADDLADLRAIASG